MTGPLKHIRILDLSRIMAGPWAGQILADLGAEVIKVERASVGDDTRRWGPPYLKDTKGNDTGESGYFLSVNRGKKSIEVDISSAEGQAVIKALAAKSDILLENFKVGTLARYGLSPDDLKAINPKLIYCSVTGFGQDGPRAKDVAYDFMIQAMGGLMSVTGVPDGEPGAGPQKVGVPIVDIMTGMYATISVLAALAERDQSGKGDTIDIAMLDVATAMLANQAMNHLVSGDSPTRKGNKHPNIQPQDVFPVRNGHIVLAVGNDEQFVRFAAAIDRADLSDDPRYATNRERVRNLDTLHPLITECLAQRDLEDWIAIFGEQKVPCGPINTVPMVFAEEQVRHRKMLQDLPHPLSGTVPSVVSPMRFARSELSFESAPPLLGEHTNDILRQLGLAEETQ
ncbi:crotonobetainyl-CoA:carnitine CoA-transferase CaiB-like acyl-CoA transferase [Primorskyibacter sedentarius]|uniref:Crotonobetainyl-CoA:carnitine CoA-transferase CaiB-like acyl-CoA transferase n=1 Tax=Primorskyibacter sedentarius TaxID=745311 RepID=A0A4R3JH29_9RHOB|nr:CoA transferase [Primorskyibacter sedentarius]TCS64623.1 crotonobetainyl-CoA:carnitine CoA-transferase CaiB-like acyl-CoA transferase [Primorskyibacter sedentarius]